MKFYSELFPPNIPPARRGLYLIRWRRTADCEHMAYWNGKSWYAPNTDSREHGDLIGATEGSINWWRGLAFDAGGADRAEGGAG